jgi:prolyl oligopeptidase
MRYVAIVLCSILLPTSTFAQWKYPPTRTVGVSDTYFGRTYPDPYRWLENLKDDEVKSWFKAQAELTEHVLGTIPGRNALFEEWMALDHRKLAAYSDIDTENGRIFYKKTLGGQNVGKLYFREGADSAEKLLFDPVSYTSAKDTTIESFVPSWDGRHVVLGLSAGGSEYSELRVLNVDTGELLPERMYPSYGADGWTADNQSFFYDAGKTTDIKSPDIELNRKTRIHKLGTAFDGDPDFFSDESYPQLRIAPEESATASIDESYPDYVFAEAATVKAEMRVFCAPVSDMASGKMNWKVVCGVSDNIVRGFTEDGNDVYAITHTDAPKYKVVRTPLKNPDWAHAETVIPEAADSVQGIVKSRHYLFVVYSDGILGRIVKYEFATGKVTDVQLPPSGTVEISCPDWRTDLCHVVVTSWTLPPTRYDYDAGKETFARSVFNTDVVYPGFDNLVTEEVQVPSYDGTWVPLSIIHKKGIPLDGSNCCILEGYGAYGDSLTPWFSVQTSIALHGVVLGYAHTRGGGEKGEAWYKAGFQTTKPNTWKDFIACAEYLVKKKYTSPEKLSGTGTSAGGILISRAITERPDLFRAAVCNVGCANAMRMEFSPNGPTNVPEFGTVKDPVQCNALFEMDGVQHVRRGVNYPAVMGVTGWNDPRVAPWQPGKFIAALQNASISGRPVLLRVNYDDGHFTEEKRVTFQNFASQDAFLLWQTGHKEFQPAQE